MGRKMTPRVGRPRSHALKPGFRPQLAFAVTAALMGKIQEARAASGRSQSAECEHRLERSFDRAGLLEEILALHYGAQLAALIKTLGDAARRELIGPNGLLSRGDIPSDIDDWDDRAFPYIADAIRAALAAATPPDVVEERRAFVRAKLAKEKRRRK